MRELYESPFILGRRFTDVEGRPLWELNAPGDLQVDVATELVACPYSGVRHTRPMNASALKQVAAHRVASVLALQNLRGWAVAAWWESAGQRLQATELWELSLLSLSIPGLLLHERGHQAVRGCVPGGLSGLHKAMMGVGTVAWSMLTVHARVGDFLFPSVDHYLHLAEEAGLFLHGDTLRACAGPPGMVRELMHTALEPPLRPAPSCPELARLGVTAGLLLPYARAVRDIELARATVALHRASRGDDIGVDEVPDWTNHLCARADPRDAARVLGFMEAYPDWSEVVGVALARVDHPRPLDPFEGALRVALA